MRFNQGTEEYSAIKACCEVASAADPKDLPTCACLAAELGFTIDCSKTAPMQTAYDALVKDCLTKCDSDECKKNFAIVEAHHDFCLHDDVPKEIEVGFHDLEEVCAMQCVIGRLKDPDHSVCEKMDCPTHESVIAESEECMYLKHPRDESGISSMFFQRPKKKWQSFRSIL